MSEPSSVTASLYPCFHFRDPEAARDWLERAFGFVAHAAHCDGAGALVHAEMRLGNGMVMFGGPRTPDPDNPWSTQGGVYGVVEDIEAHHARAQAAGMEIVRPLADTDYGSREYSVRDPEGNLWSFGTYRP